MESNFTKESNEPTLIFKDISVFETIKLNCFYPYFLENFFSKNIVELKPLVSSELEIMERSGLLYKVFYRSILGYSFNFAINLDSREILFFSQRLSDELFLSSLKKDLDLKDFVEKVRFCTLFSKQSYIEYISEKNKLIRFDKESFYENDLEKSWWNKKIEKEEKLISKMNKYKTSLFEKASDKLLDLTFKYDLVRIHLLKFLAILPCLDHDKSGVVVKSSFLEAIDNFIRDNKKASKKLFKMKINFFSWPVILILECLRFFINIFPAKLLSVILRSSTKTMAKRFIAGENFKESKKTIESLSKTNRDATLDQLGELVLTKTEVSNYTNKVLGLIDGLGDFYKKEDRNKAGILRAHVSIKVSALAYDFNVEAFDYCYEQIAPNLISIFKKAKAKSVFINIDAEHYHYRDIVWEIYKKVLSENSDFKDWGDTGIVVQAYLKDAYEHLCEIKYFSENRKIVMPIRLVKGAYWDAETVEAQAHSDIAPQFINKVETDIHFRQLSYEILSASFLQLCIASHNLEDHCFTESLRETSFPSALPIEHQCLHMTYEALSVAMSDMGMVVRNYVPVGDLLIGMAYLVRRIMENSSQAGILALMRSHIDERKSIPLGAKLKNSLETNEYHYEKNEYFLSEDFFNHPILKTYLSKYKNSLYEEVKSFKPYNFSSKEGLAHKIYAPFDNNKFVGDIDFLEKSSLLDLFKSSEQKYLESNWSKDFSFRAKCLINLSSLIKLERNRLTSLIIHESGKTFKEALADVDEAIDFIDFYLREQRRIVEENSYLPIGGVGVIAPWNFPLAISCGMSVAALVSGNFVFLKSSECTPLIAEEFVRLCHQSGIPKGIITHLVGDSKVGEALVDYNGTNAIVFTGSKKVGCNIYEKINTKLYFKDELAKKLNKKVITEMGGKNAIIVTSSSELDETVSGVIYSAFAHAGQKCSAASRIIVHKSIKNIFMKRLVEALEYIPIGSSLNWDTSINSLIRFDDKDRVLNLKKSILDEVKRFSGKTWLDRVEVESSGHLVGPLVVEIPFKRALNENSHAQKEHFAPILHIVEYENLSDAIELVNSSEYALTFGVFSQSQKEIDELIINIEAGNIYVNRPNTGARVGIEPFGGFKFSGTGPKAGGRDYLRSFQVLNVPASSSSFNNDSKEKGSDYFKEIETNEYDVEKTYKLLEKNSPNIITTKGLFLLKKAKSLFDTDYLEPNTYIPGQKSHTFFANIKEQENVFISSAEFLNEKTVNLLGAVALSGQRTYVVCLNEYQYTLMSNYLAGHNCIEVLRSSDALLRKIMARKKVMNTFLDVSINDLEYILSFSNQVEKNLGLKRFINLDNEVVDFDFIKIHLTRAKSLAINTMRHGAPLSLV